MDQKQQPLIHTPPLALGTYELRGSKCVNVVRTALEIGYRHIDTANLYENNTSLAKALRDSGVPREQYFITTKIYRDKLAYRDVHIEFDRARTELRSDYLDTLLIHWPSPVVAMEETLQAFLELKQRKKIRSIGVSNFREALLQEACRIAGEEIEVNQLEFHPFLQSNRMLNACRRLNVKLAAYSPLAQGGVFRDETIRRLAESCGITIPALVLGWLRQKGCMVVPKASTRERLMENFRCLDVHVPENVSLALDGLNRGLRLVRSRVTTFDGD